MRIAHPSPILQSITHTRHLNSFFLRLHHSVPPAPQPSPPQSLEWRPLSTKLTITRRIALYQALSKARLSSLITLTTMASYALTPLATSIPPASLTTLLATASGTFLCSASANTLNQIFEAPMDAQMTRTRARPLARKIISTHHATVFASLTGLSGSVLLATVVNPTTALVGLANLVLYAFVYTPLKRITVINTWVGALVGGLPALMGSTAAGGALADPASWLTTGLLYVWQFPHFNALAHSLRRDYGRAGYQMLASVHPAWNARVSLRYALATLPLSCFLLPHYGLTTWAFALLSLAPNLALVLPALSFWLATPDGPASASLLRKLDALLPRSLNLSALSARFQSKSRQNSHARMLFWASLIHLPTLLILMMACRHSPDPPVPDPHQPPQSH